jgi:hypothetical protein
MAVKIEMMQNKRNLGMLNSLRSHLKTRIMSLAIKCQPQVPVIVALTFDTPAAEGSVAVSSIVPFATCEGR